MAEQHHGIFSGKPAPQQAPQPQGPQIGDIVRRLKVIEEAVDNIRRKNQMNEQTMLESGKRQNATIRTFGEEIDEMKKTVSDLHDDMRLIVEELRMTAKIEEVKVLQKYIDLWNPVNFVTAEEVKRIFRDLMERQ